MTIDTTTPATATPATATTAPATDTPSPGTGFVTEPLRHALPAVVVHTALRREFRLAAPLVRDVATGDVARAETVARHLDLLFRLLHHHHELEDELVWPPLRERAAENIVAIVDLMEDQHVEIARLVGAGAELISPLRTAEAGPRDRLAVVLDKLHGRLIEHLDLEEHVVLPLAERHLTITEWEEIGRRADAEIRPDERALTFGILQYEGDPDVLAVMLGGANRVVRSMVPRLARRAYRRHAIVVHGTATP